MKRAPSHRNDDDDVIRITITLKRSTYEQIKTVSKSVGLRPSTWISMTATTGASGISVRISKDGQNGAGEGGAAR